MELKKILYIVTQSEWGGAQKYVYELATHLTGQFEVAVVCGGKGELIKKLKAKGIKVFVLKNLVRSITPWRDFLAFFEIYKLIKREKPDLVHTNSSKAEVLGNLAARWARVPKIIFTAHGFVFNETTGFKRKILVWLERLAAGWADKIIAVSDFDKQGAIKEKIATSEKIVTIRHGLDFGFFQNLKVDNATKRREFDVPTDAPLIGTVANFYKTKGLKYFIEAASVVVKELPETHFIIVGEGKLKPKLEKQIKRLGLQNKITLTGFHHDALEIMTATDIFVLPSLKEGLPFALLEAGALGKPTVATKIGGVPEIVDDKKNGLLVPPAQSGTLAEALLTLLQNKKMAEEFGQNLKKKIFNNFNLARTIQNTVKIYQSITHQDTLRQ